MLFSDERIMLETQAKEQTNEVDEEILHMRKILKTELVDMDLSVRALNCLKAADIRTLADLVTYDVADMLKFRNFGKKSLTEIQELVKSKGLSFGMNLAKYKLDEE
jgi:DNA-directed RNA polymerase subunit alpha